MAPLWMKRQSKSRKTSISNLDKSRFVIELYDTWWHLFGWSDKANLEMVKTIVAAVYDMIWYDIIWFDMIRYGTIRYETMRYYIILYIILYDTVAVIYSACGFKHLSYKKLVLNYYIRKFMRPPIPLIQCWLAEYFQWALPPLTCATQLWIYGVEGGDDHYYMSDVHITLWNLLAESMTATVWYDRVLYYIT